LFVAKQPKNPKGRKPKKIEMPTRAQFREGPEAAERMRAAMHAILNPKPV
jgi:hypothetical protein